LEKKRVLADEGENIKILEEDTPVSGGFRKDQSPGHAGEKHALEKEGKSPF